MIIKIINSPVKNKRFRVYLNNGDKYDFGLKGASTYIDHHDEKKRENYLNRHMGNNKEKELITKNIPSPSLFSAKLLWGESTDLFENVYLLNKILS